MENAIVLGGSTGADGAVKQALLLGSMANRHGLIAGATGTGKTVTLQVLAEGFSRMGVPVFTADVKGDLSGISQAGKPHAKIDERKAKLKIEHSTQRAYPTLFWDLFGAAGHPVRTTISELGPLLLSRLLDLNDTQEGVLELAFRVADDQGLLLLDLKDLRSLIAWVGENASTLQTEYGNVAASTIGAVQRKLLSLDEAGAEHFFGEPALRLEHLMQVDFSGNGVISVVDATKIIEDPRVYTTFLLWLLSELFEQLPEVGDAQKPKMVFFFDEAHLLFKDAPKALLQKIETVVRLVRSKGVGVYFITQNPDDIPETVLSQLGNRVQHALRAYTPSAQKEVKAAASAFRENPAIDTEAVISELAVGEALVSTLDAQGTPSMVERVLIAPPESRIGPITPEERQLSIGRSPIKGLYEQAVDRESAYEVLKKRKEEPAAEEKSTKSKQEDGDDTSMFEKITKAAMGGGSSRRQGAGEAFVKSVLRSFGSQMGRQIMRGIMGSMSKR